MSKNAAASGRLGQLHAKVAEVMLDCLNEYDAQKETFRKANDIALELRDDPNAPPVMLYFPEPSAALLGAITKFLKDNEITCNTDDGDTLSALDERLKNKKAKAPMP